MRVEEDVALSNRCSLELGGAARFYCEVDREEEVVEALRWARDHRVEVTILGGGTNVVVADQGVDGLVLRPRMAGIRFQRDGDRVLLEAAAGEDWDKLVEESVAEGLYGLECLSGIPGTVGAAPVQNIGAYSQDLAAAAQEVRVLDRNSLEVRSLAARDCGFGYRTSRFRQQRDRYLILSVTLALSSRPLSRPRHGDLSRVLAVESTPGPAELRAAVLEIRQDKSMVVRPRDVNRRSVGSFFVNPVVRRERADKVEETARAMGTLRPGEDPPFYVVSEREVKIAAAWLIEGAGFEKGDRRGPVGISSRHALALVHHGGGKTSELLALAAEIRSTVDDVFGITLAPEPVFLGFGSADPLMA